MNNPYIEKLLNVHANKRNKEICIEYIRFKQSQGVSNSRLARITSFLCQLLRNFDFNFSSMSVEQLEDIVIWINSQNWKEWTKYTNLRILKNFVRFLNERYGLSLPVDRIKVKEPKNSLMPEYLITEEEFVKLMNATDDLQFKTLLGILYESGARIGEILNLKIQNVEFNDYGAKLYIKGKTGQRVVPIVWFANMLRQYIEAHPFKHDPEAPVWYCYKNGKFEALSYNAFRIKLKRLCKKAGINKRIYPHLFRHSRLTELAKQLPEQTLKLLAGWAADSKMAKTYIHLSCRDVEESLLARVYGIKVNDENSKEERLKICPKCKEANPYFAKYCMRCQTPLDEKELRRLVLSEEKIKEIVDWAEVFLLFFKILEKKYPELWNDFRATLKKAGKEYLIS